MGQPTFAHAYHNSDIAEWRHTCLSIKVSLARQPSHLTARMHLMVNRWHVSDIAMTLGTLAAYHLRLYLAQFSFAYYLIIPYRI